MSYFLEGQILEICTCNVVCPCWVGEDPDGGECDGVLAWHIDKGRVEGIDVSGLTFVALCHIPGNILKGNWSAQLYVDQEASEEQKEAMLRAFTGKLGGPLQDIAQLIGNVNSIEQMPISFSSKEGESTLKVGSAIEARTEYLKGATGKEAAMYDTVFTTVPGAPAYIGKTSRYRVSAPLFELDLKGRNAVSTAFRFESESVEGH